MYLSPPFNLLTESTSLKNVLSITIYMIFTLCSLESKMTKENSQLSDNDKEEDLNKTEDFLDPSPVYDLPMDPKPVHDVPIDRGWAWVILFSMYVSE